MTKLHQCYIAVNSIIKCRLTLLFVLIIALLLPVILSSLDSLSSVRAASTSNEFSQSNPLARASQMPNMVKIAGMDSIGSTVQQKTAVREKETLTKTSYVAAKRVNIVAVKMVSNNLTMKTRAIYSLAPQKGGLPGQFTCTGACARQILECVGGTMTVETNGCCIRCSNEGGSVRDCCTPN